MCWVLFQAGGGLHSPATELENRKLEGFISYVTLPQLERQADPHDSVEAYDGG